MALTETLHKLATRAEYGDLGRPQRRWGQVLREPPSLQATFQRLRESEAVVPLIDVADLTGGTVTRANAFFVVRELRYEEVPERFRITKRDYQRVAVIEDGRKTLHPIERVCLRPIIKGPELLRGPTALGVTDNQLFDCQDRSKDELRELRANDALKYLKRGETVPYNVSDDALKGGIPAQRSNIKDRKPYWYSLHTPSPDRSRIIVPEHFDERFPATLLAAGDDAVVLDKLFIVTPHDDADAMLLLAGLNSILSWYQFEYRGRTQLGEGVLELKRADWAGLLVANPQALDDAKRGAVLEAFASLAELDITSVDDELAREERVAFDTAYLEAMGIDCPDAARTELERALRAAMSERKERAGSVADAKATRATSRRVPANVDAYASRIAADMETYPDPRTFVPDGAERSLIIVAGPVEGTLTIGDDLLTQGDVFAGDHTVASAGDMQSARFVRGALLQDPELSSVEVPTDAALDNTLDAWEAAIREWRDEFTKVFERAAGALIDDRMQGRVRKRALALLHAE
jgi:hypothetical protein